MSSNYGFTIIEVLVSLLVLSIGLLGLAALEISALKFNRQGYFQSIAGVQLQNMADRMRANMSGVTAGSYNSISGIGSNTTCSPCSAAQMAQQDAYQWNSANATLLPSGQGTVTGNGTSFNITVMWDDNRTGATGTGCSGNTAVDLTCLTMSFRP